MKQQKKEMMWKFRSIVFERDNHKCKICGKPAVNAHHITDIPNGMYVIENGVSLCDQCYIKAENYRLNDYGEKGYSPDELYELIGSNKYLAYKKSKGEFYCEEGFHGDCCCTCKNHYELMKHPWNSNPYKGSASESAKLWVCVVDLDRTREATIHTYKHGYCELYVSIDYREEKLKRICGKE